MADSVDEKLAEKSNLAEPDRTRESIAALGIGLVVILVGVPIWWKTTEVYRCQLPYAEIDELASLPLEQTVRLDVVSCFDSDKHNLVLHQQLTDSLNHRDGADNATAMLGMRYIVNFRKCMANEMKTFQDKTLSLEDLSVKLYLVASSSVQGHGNFTVYIALSDQASHLVYKKESQEMTRAVLTRRRQAIVLTTADDLGDIKEVVGAVIHLVRDVVVNERSIVDVLSGSHQQTTSQTQSDKNRMRAIKLSSGYDVTFSLINSQPSNISPQWNINSAINKYLGHFLDSLKEFITFNIRSQFLHNIALGVIAGRDDKAGCSVLTMDQLPHIINPIEAHLGSYVSNNPSINFIVYIPRVDQMPLKIYDEAGKPSKTNALFSPRWGGVYFYNVDAVTMTTTQSTNHSGATEQSTSHDEAMPRDIMIDMGTVMSVFAAQLRVLVGFHSKTHSHTVKIQSASSHIISEWELDAWLRERCIENLATTSSTLKSLSELLSKISNLVINDDIGKQVQNAVRLMRATRGHLLNSELRQAFLTSHAALIASEKAFFDPSLLELLYFPEDQKFAIYIPLFLPVGLPIVLSCIQAVKWLKKRYRPNPPSSSADTNTADQSVKPKSE